jgi:hypothetical protein
VTTEPLPPAVQHHWYLLEWLRWWLTRHGPWWEWDPAGPADG